MHFLKTLCMNPLVWEGRVPVHVKSNETQIFCHLYRVAYLPPQLLPRAAAALPGLAIDDTHFATAGDAIPISKIHYPVGVLYDMLVRSDPDLYVKPWLLQLLVDDSIGRSLVKDLKAHFYSQLKEVPFAFARSFSLLPLLPLSLSPLFPLLFPLFSPY